MVEQNKLITEYSEGDFFLEKDTMTAFRSLSEDEILLLETNYYKGVKLNGYYIKGDIGSSVKYFLTNSGVDDGGSVIHISGDTYLYTIFNKGANVLNFGAQNNAGRYIVEVTSSSKVIKCTSKVFSNSLIGTEVNLTNIIDTSNYNTLKATVISVNPNGKELNININVGFTANAALLFTNRFDSGLAIQKAGDYAVANSVNMVIPGGNYFIKTSFDINGNPSGGILDDNQRVEFKITSDNVNLYYDNELSYKAPSLSVFGFIQITHLTLKNLSIKGWNNNYRWFNYSNSNNVPSPVPVSGQPFFRIMGFDRLVIDSCNFEDIGGSIAIMGHDQSSTTVNPNTYINSGELVFTNNVVSNCWQISMTRGRGRDYIINNNIFKYVSHKFYSNINHVGNHIYTNNIFKDCPRLLFGINDGLIFTANVLDCVLNGIELQGFSHVNYYDYGRKNIIISNNIFNNTKGGLTTLANSADASAGTTIVYGKNVLIISNPIQYQATGTAKFKSIIFSNNIIDSYGAVSSQDALFLFQNQDIEIEDISVINNHITANRIADTEPIKILLNFGSAKISKLYSFENNIVNGLRNSVFPFDMGTFLKPEAIARINNNYIKDINFKYGLFNIKGGIVEFTNNIIYMGDIASNFLGVLYLTSPQKTTCNNNTLNNLGVSGTGCMIFVVTSTAGANNGIVIRANNNSFNNIANVIRDPNEYTAVGGFIECTGNMGQCLAPILDNFSSRTRNLTNPTYSGNTPPIVTNKVNAGYVTYCFNKGSDGTYAFVKLGNNTWLPMKEL